MARTAILHSSAILRVCLTSSFLRSSVSSGSSRRMIFPSLVGLMPRSDFWISFSMTLSMLCSQGAIWMMRGSGMEMLATWLMGVGEP